jgi:hypothetical protein
MKMVKRNLIVPMMVRQSNNYQEIIRAWIVDNRQIVQLSESLWKDPAAWGIFLVDLINHVANAYDQAGFDRSEVIAAIKKTMEAEWKNPTE